MYISVKIVCVVLVQDACSGGRPAQGEEAAAQSDDPGRRPASSRRGPARNIRNPCSLWPPAASSRATHSDWFVAQRAGRTWSLHCGLSGGIRHTDFNWYYLYTSCSAVVWMTFDCAQDRNFKCPLVPAYIPQCSGEARWPGPGLGSPQKWSLTPQAAWPRPSTASCCQAAGDTAFSPPGATPHTTIQHTAYTTLDTSHTTLFTHK